MKKNRMMRLASVLLIMTLLSTSVISGTFAKYVTEASSYDQARVAKWGVTVTAQGDAMFKNQYSNTENGVTVKSVDNAKVVAPGTSSTEGGSATFSINGTPEVTTKVDVNIDDGFKDIYLKAGTYTDFTKVVDYNGTTPLYATFTLSNDYYPVKWTLKYKDASENVTDWQTLKTGSLSDIKTFITDYVSGNKATYAPNTNLGAEYQLTWEWKFEQDNQADTWLGNMAAGLAYDSVSAEDYSTTIAYNLTITATQID